MAIPKMKTTAGVLLALSCAASFVAPAAHACAFHNVIPEAQIDGMYPGSLAVAVALRNAADDGAIDAATLEGATTGALPYIDVTRGLRSFGMALAASPAAGLPPRFSLGYVESRLWTRYSFAAGKVGVEIHTDGPVDGEPVVLTGEPVLAALRDGTLSIDDAVADGLVVILANEADTAAIREALAAAAHRISLN